MVDSVVHFTPINPEFVGPTPKYTRLQAYELRVFWRMMIRALILRIRARTVSFC